MRRVLLVFLAVVLMMYLYPLSIIPLLRLAREWDEFNAEWSKSALFIGLSILLYGAKIALGISGWAKTLGITPVYVSPTVWWAVYYVYLVGRNLGGYAKIGGLAMVVVVPLHLLQHKLLLCPHVDWVDPVPARSGK